MPGMPDWLWIQNVVFPLVGMGMGVLFMFGVYRVAMRWIDRRHERLMVEGAAPGGGAEVAQLRSRVEVLEDALGRVQELEERVDFAERLLTRAREHPELRG
jgi:hypothetical protein